jgi:hypothetical protein
MTQNCNCHGSGGQYSQTAAAILERPRYSPGLILEDSDLTSAVDYTRQLSRLLFRNLFGCGVICGLTVKVERDCGLKVTVAPGLALDGCGDPIQLPAPAVIMIDKQKDEQVSKAGGQFWVTLCGKEKLCEPRAMVCEADDYDGVNQATRVRALSEVSITFGDRPTCVCGCPPDAGHPGATPQGYSADPCHIEHETRVDCAEDCGCGTACDCGCCVLLAQAKFTTGAVQATGAIGPSGWAVVHKGVRRLVRAALVPDREPPLPVTATRSDEPQTAAMQVAQPPPPPPPVMAPAPTDVYWGNDGGATVEAVRTLYPDTKPGDRLDQDQVRKIVDWIAKRKPASDVLATENVAAPVEASDDKK